MASLGIFLAPIIAISISDYWIIKTRRVDVPSLYRPIGRYQYRHGVNWRAVVALLVALGPTMPSLAKNINANVDIGGAIYIADLVWYYGMLSAFVTYVSLSLVFPAKQSLVSKMEVEVMNGEGAGVVGLYEGTEKEKEAGIILS
jgi:NCS1 family nucleobase:cation symporter-1